MKVLGNACLPCTHGDPPFHSLRSKDINAQAPLDLGHDLGGVQGRVYQSLDIQKRCLSTCLPLCLSSFTRLGVAGGG